MPDRLQTPRPVRPPGHTGQTGMFRLLPILVVNRCHSISWMVHRVVSKGQLDVDSQFYFAGKLDKSEQILVQLFCHCQLQNHGGGVGGFSGSLHDCLCEPFGGLSVMMKML